MADAFGNDVPAPAAAPVFRSDWERLEYKDTNDRERTHTALIDWHDSNDYHRNLRLIDGHLDQLPVEEREKYERGALEDGTRLLNDPGTLRQLAADARQAPPMLEELAKKFGGNQRAAIESMMGQMDSPYRKGPHSEQLQAVYLDLTREAEEVKANLLDRSQYPQREFDRTMSYVRTNAGKPGFEEKHVAELIRGGLTPARAWAVASFFKERIYGHRG